MSFADRVRGPQRRTVPFLKQRHRLLGALTLLGFVSVAGCAALRPGSGGAGSPVSHDVNGELAAAVADQYAPGEYVVGPDDLLVVTAHDITEDAEEEAEDDAPQEVRARVSQAGEITLPLIGAVEVAGLTVPDIEELLRERYRTYILEPQLSVRIEEYRSYRVSVLGYVERPGLYELQGQRSLLEVLNLAGGLGPHAGAQVQITRRTRSGVRTHYVDLDRVVRDGDMRFNVPVRAGDVIYVPKVASGAAVGQLHRPWPGAGAREDRAVGA